MKIEKIHNEKKIPQTLDIMTDVVSKLGKATVVFRIAKTKIPMREFRMPPSSWSREGIIAESLDHRLYL